MTGASIAGERYWGMDIDDTARTVGAALERGLVGLTEQLVFWLPRVAIAAIAILLAIRVGRWAARLASRPFGSTTPTVQRFVGRATELGIAVVGIALALNVLGLGAFAAGILASGSIVAIVLGFAFQEIGKNLIAGVFLAFNRPFKTGDIIACDGFTGEVRALDLRTTHIRNFDGRDIFIPNAIIFTQTLVNYTIDDLRRRAFRVGVRYEDDAHAAMELLRAAVTGIRGVLREPAPTAVIVELSPSTVDIEVAYWVSMDDSVRVRARVRASVMDACRRALLDAGYTVAPNVTTAVELAGSPSPQAVRIDMQRAGAV